MLVSEILTAARVQIVDLVADVDSQLVNFLNQAVRDAESIHNFRYMESTLNVVTVESTRLLVAKPSTWKESREAPFLTAYDGGRGEFDWASSESDMVRQYGISITLDAGAPQFVLETPTELHVYPLPDDKSTWPDGDYRVTVPYWAFSSELVDDNTSNWWTENEPWYLIYQVAAMALIALRDTENAAVKAQLATTILRKVEKRDKRSRLPDRMTLSISRGAFRPGNRPRRGPYGRGYLP